jgi:hypothetical protein
VRTLVLAGLLCIGCGRSGFEAVITADAAADAIVADAPLSVLPCVAPRAAIDPATTALSATATLSGYDVFAVDSDGQVHGYGFHFDDAGLTTAATNVDVAPNATGPLAPLAIGDDVLMVMPYGRPDATGTSLIALNPQLGTKSAVMADGFYGASGALTHSASGAAALITQRLAGAAVNPGQVEAKLVSPAGDNVLGPRVVIDGAQGAYNQMILPATSGLVVAWDATNVQPSVVRAERVDDRFMVTSPEPVQVSPSDVQAISPRGAYLASASRYLFVWYQKLQDGGDQVWGSLRNADLSDALGQPILITRDRQGATPVVVAGKDDFLIVWESDTGSLIGAARVSTTGQITDAPILSTGGQAAAWDLVVRNGQPALIWLERDGVGKNLWIDPLCSQ